MLNYLKYEWDICKKNSKEEYKYLIFELTLGSLKNVRHVNVYVESGDKQSQSCITEEIELNQLVQLRDFLNSVPFTEEEQIFKLKELINVK